MKPKAKPKEWAKVRAEIFDKSFAVAHKRVKGAVKQSVPNPADDEQARLLLKALHEPPKR